MSQSKVVFRQLGNVILRPIEKDDIKLFVRWMNDPEVTRFISSYLPVTSEFETSWIESLERNRNTEIVLMIEVDGIPIGTTGLHAISPRNRTANTGAIIGEKEYWGKGHGTVSKMLMLDFAFNTLNLRKVCSSVLAFNDRSHAYLKKCGYVEEGRKTQQFYVDGQYCDEIIMAVFKENWLPLWIGFQEKHRLK